MEQKKKRARILLQATEEEQAKIVAFSKRNNIHRSRYFTRVVMQHIEEMEKQGR